MKKERMTKIGIFLLLVVIVISALLIFAISKFPINLNYIYITCAIIATGIISFFEVRKHILDVESAQYQLAEAQKIDDPINFINRLGVYLFSIKFGSGLKCITEDLKATPFDLRIEITDELGFILPTVWVYEDADIEKYEYTIQVRDNVVASGHVYPDKFMVLASEWDSRHDDIPEDAIVGVEPIWQTQVYWIDKETADKNKKYINVVSPTDVIKNHLREIAIKYANDLVTIVDVGRYIEQAKTIDKGIIPTLEKLNKRLSIEDIRQVFANLITEEVSVRDICYIFERLADYARKSAEPDVLSERIREDLKVQISAKNADVDNVLYAIKLSKEWEKTLEEHLERTALGYVLIMESEQFVEFVEAITEKLEVAQECIGRLPVILCAPKNRLPIYKMLKRHIPTVVVMSYLEIADTVKLETVATIGEE